MKSHYAQPQINSKDRTRFFFTPFLLRAVFSYIACIPLCNTSFALTDPGDSINFSANINYLYDDNLFRLPDNYPENILKQELGTSETSDRILISSAGLNLNTEFSLQTLDLNAKVSRYNYNRFDQLNFTGFDYDLLWGWSITPNIKGTLSLVRQDLPTSYEDYRGSNPNQRKLVNRHFTLDGHIAGGWSVIGRLNQDQRENKGEFIAEDSFNQIGLEGGLKYEFRSGSFLTGLLNTNKGKFDREPVENEKLDNKYDQQGAKLSTLLNLTPKSIINGEIGYLKREHKQYNERDYDGTYGNISYIWEATGKINVRTTLSRALGSYQDVAANYTTTNAFILTPSYQATDKLSFQIRYEQAIRQFEGNPHNIPNLKFREDNTYRLNMSATWNILHSIDLTLNIEKSERESNQIIYYAEEDYYDPYNYETYAAFINLGLLF